MSALRNPLLRRVSVATASLLSAGTLAFVIGLPPGDAQAGPTTTTTLGTTTTTTLAPTPTTLSVTSSSNPSVVGQAVNFSATVSPAEWGGFSPTGTMVFVEGKTVIGVAKWVGPGTATFTIAFSSAGTTPLLVVFYGDQAFQGSRGGLTQVVEPPATSPGTTPTIPGATGAHTGEPWAGSTPLALAAALAGLGLGGWGVLRRRRWSAR
jgi:hypothetical protein